jgi:hypothetical protein
LIGSKRWLAMGAALLAGAAVSQQPGQQPGQPAGGRSQTAAPQRPPAADTPDEDFIEFLGEDDHGDGTWSDMVKKAQQQPGSQNPAPPPQGTKPS